MNYIQVFVKILLTDYSFSWRVFVRRFVESNGSYESSRFLSALYRRYSLFERHPYCVQCVQYTDFVQYLEGATFDFFFLATVIALVSLSSRVGASA